MKKLTITTVLLIAGTVFVNAETNSQVQKLREMVKRPVAQKVVASSTRPMPTQDIEGKSEGMMPVLSTGDDAIDAQIKVLAIEMETKVKLIRDEYQTKIKASFYFGEKDEILEQKIEIVSSL